MPFPEAGRSALKKLTRVVASAPKSHASKLVSHQAWHAGCAHPRGQAGLTPQELWPQIRRLQPAGASPRGLRRWLPGAAGGALAGVGISRRSAAGAALALAGGALAYGSLSGKAPLPSWLRARLPQPATDRALLVKRAVTIQRPPEELYAFWRDFTHLPRFMRYLQSVTVQPGGRSHWVANGPAGSRVEWDAEIVEERPGALVRWQALPGAQVPNRGEVRFQPAPAGRGTEVRVRLEYEPPAGSFGATLAQLLGQGADRQVRESLRNFKQLMEAGEIPINEHQPRGTCLKG